MQVDDPPYLSVGTAVSAKYKGAFCEAKVSKVVHLVKCKVTFKMGLGTAQVNDEHVRGTLRVGHTVQAKHPEKKDFVEGVITKIQDQSQYTVVFDDGDITTLRRSALCLKSGRHFNESETLDQLPLTHPEHFGNPVVGGRRGRRNRQLKEDSSEGEGDEENEPDMEGYSTDIGRVVSVETSDKKRNKDNWFPGLVVIPSAQPTVRINAKDEYLVRSFKDGRYYTVPKTEISEFVRDTSERSESCSEAISKAIKYLDDNELPAHWERNSLFNMQPVDTDSDDNLSETSDDEPNEEKDLFVAQLYKFMDDSGTPLNKSPMIGNKDVDLHSLFRAVQKLGGYNRVNNNTKWKVVTNRLKFANNQITCNQVKSVYKKCLLSYEAFDRTLGVTMLNHTRSTKKNRGRSLIRDKDRATPVNSPKPEKEDEIEKKEEKPVINLTEEIKKKKIEVKKEEMSDTNSSDATDQSEPIPGTSREVGRPRRLDKSKRGRFPVTAEKSVFKKEEDEKQITRSKSQAPKLKQVLNSPDRRKDIKAIEKPTPGKIVKKEEEKKRGRKKLIPDEPPKVVNVDAVQVPTPGQGVNVGDKLKVYYGPTHEKKVTYEAKVLEIAKDANGPIYCVHYTGWNTRYDEWIVSSRIAENLSATTKAKRLKQAASGSSVGALKAGSAGKAPAGKRGRGMSITGRSTATTEAPRSTTPSSVTSSSSRTKSPATPATRSTSRLTRQDSNRRTRRASAQTDFSNHSESDTEISESESELTRTRSGSKNEEVEPRTYKKRSTVLTRTKIDKSKDSKDEDGDGEDLESRTRRSRKVKKSPEKSTEESDEDGGTNPPKGRDFDLNQIRSELKGFGKALKVPPVDDKDASSSSDDSNTLSVIKQEELSEDNKKDKSPSSDDIYEFKEPEPFEFESRKPGDDKGKKRLVPRLFEDLEKSPKRKSIKSPGKSDKDSPEVEKKRFRRTTPKKDESDDEDSKKSEDPFDKLVESPSFNLVKPSTSEKCISAEAKQKVTRSILDEPLSLFHEPPDTVDDYSRDMELSDTESQTQPIFSTSVELFSDTFSKHSPERNTLDMFPPKVDDLKKQDSLDFASITESINRKIEQPNSSDDCNDDTTDDELSITPSMTNYQRKKGDVESNPPSILSSTVDSVKSESQSDVNKEVKSPALHISPALQETDSSLLESICSSQPISIQAKLEETKDINVKTGTKIADSILQKFNSIKNTKDKSGEDDDDLKKDCGDDKIDDKIKIEPPPKVELKAKPTEEVKKPLPQIPELNESKKRRKVLSRRYIEESDSDSSDSEQLVIARSDDDSRTNSLDKPDLKGSDSNVSGLQMATTDDSQSQEEEQRNFKFDKREKSASPEPEIKEERVDAKTFKDEEPDSHLDSLLLCDETIPRSPAPVSEGPSVSEQARPTKSKSMLEMPFASAPGSMNNQKMLLNPDHKPANKPQPPPLVLPLDNRDNRDNRDTSTVLDNTPPTTPESTISNLSPRGDHGDLSPNTLENESGKSNDGESDFSRKRRTSSANKPSLFSEEDSQLTEPSSKKPREDPAPVCKKRRKSTRTSDEVPAKRGRKPLNRSRHNSDSDDTSEHSMSGATSTVGLSVFDRASRSPRPSKYNFFVEFDQDLNSGQRIAILQQKLSELRKTYTEVKAELATVERRRKKIRRREREALKASKQEMAST